MSDEDLAELRGLHERATRDYASELHYRRLAFHVWIPDLLAEAERLHAELAGVCAAIDAWQDGTLAPHDALTAIRDRLTRGPR